MQRISQRAVCAVIICITFMFTMPVVQAARIVAEAADVSITAGDTVVVTIAGREFTDGEGGTLGGGLSFSWDPSILTLESWNTEVFPGDQFFANDNTTTTVDNTVGTLANVSVSSFSGTDEAAFDIAQLVFRGVGMGTSSINIGSGYFDSGREIVWVDNRIGAGAFDLQPSFIGTEVTVIAASIPLPAALPLLTGALVLLGAAQRRT